MAGYKSYDNVDPNEIFKLVNAYTGQMYPKEQPTDLTDAIQNNNAQEEQFRQAEFQKKIAESLPNATDEKSVADLVLQASKETGQADQFLKASKLKDQYEFDDILKAIGQDTNNTPEDVRNKAGAAYLNHGDMEKYLALAKQNEVKTQFRNGMVYRVNPDGTYTAERDPFAPIKGPKESRGDGESGPVEYILKEDPDTGESKIEVEKAGSRKGLEARANGAKIFNTEAELVAYQANSKLKNAENEVNKPKEPGFFSSIAKSLIGNQPTATPTPKPISSQGAIQPPAGYEFTGSVDAQGRKGIRKKQ